MAQVKWKAIAHNMVVGDVYQARIPGGWLYAGGSGIVFVPISEVAKDEQGMATELPYRFLATG